MTSISNAVGSDRISKVVGYQLTKGNFATTSPNLPQRIVVLGPLNHTNQSTPVTPTEIVSASQAGTLYGFGSPIHSMMRILRNPQNDLTGGIPTVVIPQVEAVAATPTVIVVHATGTASGNATHYIEVNGRTNIDGSYYQISIVTGDTRDTINAKIAAAINAVVGCPGAAVVSGTTGATIVTMTSLYYSALSVQMDLVFNTNGNAAGITYSIDSTTAGTGAESLTAALLAFGSQWATIVINPYDQAAFAALEAFNGIPDPTTPTGRYAALIFKPFISIWGSVEHTAATLGAITDAKKAQVTHALAPAPYSAGFTWEASANMAVLFANTAQNSPELDISGQSYPDMPVPDNAIIGDMSDYNQRDYLVKLGASTVDLVAGVYLVQDFVTCYHPVGETPPQYRYCRNLMLDFNVRFSYYLREQTYVVGRTLMPDTTSTTSPNVIKPKDWKQQLISLANDLVNRALVADAKFMINSIQVQIDSTNPDRFDTFFEYQRTGIARISSTTAEAGFYFGTN